jgi:uncharacterized membrane protein required for colicin V production
MQIIQAFAFDFSQFRFGWIDFVTLIAILLGLHLGNRSGASKQILSFGLWLLVLLIAAVGYRFLGPPLAALSGMQGWMGDLIAYVILASVSALVLAMINRKFADRVEATTAFGKMEYVIGPGAAMIRNLAIILVIIGAIHGLSVSPVVEQRERKEQMHNYGMILYPTKGMIRAAVFENSTTGALAERFLSFLMVDPDRPVQEARLR